MRLHAPSDIARQCVLVRCSLVGYRYHVDNAGDHWHARSMFDCMAVPYECEQSEVEGALRFVLAGVDVRALNGEWFDPYSAQWESVVELWAAELFEQVRRMRWP